MMKRLQRDAILLSLIRDMREKGSWCGETHVQKATYFLQELIGVPLGFEFILYKHGPFSFDLSDEITALRADSLIQYQPRPPYGPSLLLTEESDKFLELFPKTIRNNTKKLQFVAEKIGTLGVADLERVATALYVTLNENGEQRSRENQVIELKPHIGIDDAYDAVKSVDDIIKEARAEGLADPI